MDMEESVHALGNAWYAVAQRLGHEVSPASARSIAARENRWTQMEREFGMLTSGEIARACGLKPSNRQWAADQRAGGRLLGVRRGSRVLHPGFQVDPDGALRAVIGEVAECGRRAGWSDSSVLLWFVAPTSALVGDRRPVDLLDDDPDAVVAAARNKFAEQW